MIVSKAIKRNIIFFAAAVFLCGVLHILLYQVDFALCFSQMFCCVLTILWAISVVKRVTNYKLRAMMLWVTVALLLLFLLQILRYSLLDGNITARRYLWYAMYIPMTGLPLLCFFLALYIHRPQNKPLLPWYYLFIVIGVLLVIGVLTNDLHFWAKSFPTGVLDDNGQEINGWLYYAIEIFTYSLYVLAFSIKVKKNRRYVARKYRWIAAVPLLIGVIYFLLYPLDLGQRFFSTRIYQMGEMLAFCVIASLEACIQVGMIPANHNYEKLFSATDLPAAILDRENKPIYQTAGIRYPFEKSENTKIVSHPIPGGSIEYLVDIRQVKELNLKLAEQAQQIETRNAYISAENRIKQERAELETRNRLYERVSSIVKPQLEQIDDLLNVSHGCGTKELATIAVLKAYIKRRSNMELLAAAGTLTVVELASAVTESLDYMRLYGANTAVSAVGTGSYPADMVIAAYEHIEQIVEECMDSLSDMAVTIRSAGKELIVRMMLKAENFSYESNGIWPDVSGFSRFVSITKENQDMIIVITFMEGSEWK
ncbi:MAG: hypothetical protein IKS90_04760 [Clostridia bacterium]|nr:hypothetical protein [Clostridia bacterium]